MANNDPMLSWDEGGREITAAYASLRGGAAPKRAVTGNDTLTGDAAFRLVSQGTAIVWRGDFVNGRQLLQALGRRVDKRLKVLTDPQQPEASFNSWRQVNAQRANMLSLLLVPMTGGTVTLSRAPYARGALDAAFGEISGDAVVPLRDVLTVISAAEWHRKGVPVAALGASIHPLFGVFPPTRQDYVGLMARAPLPKAEMAFDLGTGSGVLGAVLLKRGVPRLIATDISESAVATARDSFDRLGFGDRATIVPGTLYPDGKAGLIVCNPPWLPGKAGTDLEAAVYDTGSAMLREFVSGLTAHLEPGGEGWLVMSNLAEHLGLRKAGELEAMIAAAGLEVAGKLDTPPATRGAKEKDDPLYFARSKEVVSLWRLKVQSGPSSA